MGVISFSCDLSILDRYYDEHASKLPSANAARLAIEFFREVCPDISVADFRKKEQRRVADILRGRGASEGYVSRVLSVARAALLRAFDDEELSSVPKFIKLKRDPGAIMCSRQRRLLRCSMPLVLRRSSCSCCWRWPRLRDLRQSWISRASRSISGGT